MKQNRWIHIYEVFVHFSVYPLLILVGGLGILTCGLVIILTFRLTDAIRSPTDLDVIVYASTTSSQQMKVLPNSIPTATETPTVIPSPTFTFTPLPPPNPASVVAAITPAAMSIPVIYPTSGPLSAANSALPAIPIIYPTPGSPVPPLATLTPSPDISPTATLTPVPEYDFMLAEFFNSPTTNDFLLIYVAIVDPKEVPIGDIKIVGVRQNQNLTFESPLSTWYYEGYNAPSEVIKSGNVKFEPPGGIENTSWVLHLEDAHGSRQSADVSFNVDANDKQWYFIKFRRKY